MGERAVATMTASGIGASWYSRLCNPR